MLVIVREITVALVRAMIRTIRPERFTAFTALEALGQHRFAIFDPPRQDATCTSGKSLPFPPPPFLPLVHHSISPTT